MDIFIAVSFAAILIEMVIRAPLNQRRKNEKILLALLAVAMSFVPIL